MKSCIVSIVRLGFRPFCSFSWVGWLGCKRAHVDLQYPWIRTTASIVQGNRQREEQLKTQQHLPLNTWLSSWTDKSLNVRYILWVAGFACFQFQNVCFCYATGSPYRPLYGAPWSYNMVLPCSNHFWKQPCLGKAPTGAAGCGWCSEMLNSVQLLFLLCRLSSHLYPKNIIVK